MYQLNIYIIYTLKISVCMRLQTLSIFSVLFICALCLKNMPLTDNQVENAKKYLTSPVETFRFLDNDIMFVLADHSRFGFIAKSHSQSNVAQSNKQEQIKAKRTNDKSQSPILSMVINVQPEQRISEVNDQGVVFLQQGKSKILVANSKQLLIHRPLKFVKEQRLRNSEIVHLIEFKTHQVVLTKESLILSFKGKNNKNTESLSYIYNATQTGQVQQYMRSLVKFNYRNQKNLKKSQSGTQNVQKNEIIGLVIENKQQDSRKICVKVFQISKQGKQVQEKDMSCVPISKDSTFLKSVFSTGHVFIVMSDQTIVLNLSLKIKNRLAKKPITFSQNALVMEGGVSFGQQKATLVDELIFESQENKILKLSSSEKSLIISDAQNDNKVLQLNKIGIKSKPVNCWLSQKSLSKQAKSPNDKQLSKQSQNSNKKISRDVEIIVEWADQGLNYYRYNSQSKQVVEEWKVEGNKAK